MRGAEHPSTVPSAPRAREWAALALCAALGALLRLDQIGAQLVGDDEWHSLHALRDHDLPWILTHFGSNDHCIPLTAFEWLLAQTIGLTELGMRALPLASGIAALVVLPLLLWRHLGARASLLFAFLLAISPIEIYFSRTARPYEVVFLLALAAVLALERWWSGGARAWALVYALGAVSAVWFHLGMLPFVLTPLGWCLIRRSPSAGSTPRERAEVAILGACTGFGIVLCVGPPLLGDLGSLERRSFGRSTGWPDAEVCFELLSGTFRMLPGFCFGLALLFGASAMRRLPHPLAPFLVLPSLVQLGVLWLARPAVLDQALVFVRYLLPAQGVLLVLAALGIAALDDRVRKELPLLPRHAVSAAVALALLVPGPLLFIHRAPCAWTNHAMYQSSYARSFFSGFARTVFGKQAVPPVYAELAREMAPGELMLEAPWFYASQLVPYVLYQRTHGRPFVVGWVTPPGTQLPLGELAPDDARFRLRNFLHVGDLAALRARGVRFVFFHRDPPFSMGNEPVADLQHVETWIARYRELVGKPRFEDPTLCVFDLAPH